MRQSGSDVPPLGAVRVFWIAARYGNFKRAATELGVTPTAVSSQIKSLEAHLGCPLFERHAQSVALNEAGQQFSEACEAVFARLDRAVQDARQTANRSSITVGVGALIGSQWLSRRLFSFWQRFPETGLHLQYSPGGVEFSDGQTDMMLAWGDGDWPGLTSEALLRFPTSPVISPSLIAEGGHPTEPANLLRLPLLHWKDQVDWLEWFDAHGVETGDHLPGVIIDDSSVLLRAVLSGQGVSLGLLPLIEAELQSGQLIRPFAKDFAPSRSYHLVYPSDAIKQPQLRAFRDWILQEAGRDNR
ncbi:MULTISPECIES: LysR substrate-binding domain-containing protein [unclassified Ruegeria]|uniref:LysR substrate-binding domain-containing protein n=1 Tax=unclassified Ruegeria TaxID=2625375 RepID=UPI0014889D7B|nr:MULTISPECIES: LysR substrate-binding domain-containing protein [unclassified Ruegeria]NOD36287.1 LysR family transcriptional regulator [Ruegeria sp. HKCCD7296]NOE35380.1 LysR family transcriptional regulator [Ruegeria sp. HKCCD7318]NOE42396.1 LysR family transcriptional regulator [Ruegeria sp. HKCCD7319]